MCIPVFIVTSADISQLWVYLCYILHEARCCCLQTCNVYGAWVTHHGLPCLVRRNQIFEDVIALYKDNGKDIFKEYPFRIKFMGGKAVDTGVYVCSAPFGIKPTTRLLML